MKKSEYIFVTLHVAVWSIIFLLPLIFKLPETEESGFFVTPVFFFGTINLFNAALFYFNAYFITPSLFKRKKWVLYSLCILLTFIIFSSGKVIVLKFIFDQFPMDELTFRFAVFSTFGFLFISTLYSMAVDSVRLEKKQKEMAAERLSAELKFYRSQISPHFLFNVLANIISLGRKKSDQLEPSLIMLSDMIRYALYEAKEDKVDLKKEVENLRTYVALQQLRFGHDDVVIESNLTVYEGNTLLIEPMILIPFVENAFKHGIGRIQMPLIKINLSVVNGVLFFDVWNKVSMVNPGRKETESGIGLSNIQARLKLLYGDRHQLVIINDGVMFNTKLKLQLV